VGRLTGIDTMLLDLDGTLYVGSQVVPGTPEAVRWLRAQGLKVRFTTNTDSIPQPGSPTAWPGSASRPPRTSWSPDRDRRPAVRRRTGGAGAGRGADGVRELLASCRAGRAGHPRLVGDPSYRATYDELAADIGGGHAVGAATVLVRSGKGDRPSQAPGAEPDAVVDSVADLPGLLQG
jgi:hypothetical protein